MLSLWTQRHVYIHGGSPKRDRFHGYTRAPVRVEAAATLYSLRNLFGRLAFVKFRTPQWQVCRRVCFDNFEKKLYISNVIDRNINKLFINVNEETRKRRRGENSRN